MTGCTACDAVTEIDSDGFDFRVADKGFVWSYPERHPGRPRLIRTDIAVLYVGDEAEKQALLLGEPAPARHIFAALAPTVLLNLILTVPIYALTRRLLRPREWVTREVRLLG